MNKGKRWLVVGVCITGIAATIAAIVAWKGQATEAYYIEALQSDDRDTVRQAGEYLAKHGSLAALEPLLLSMTRNKLAIRKHAERYSMGDFPEDLITTWRDEKGDFGLWAIEAAARLRAQNADLLPIIARGLEHESWEIVALSVFILGQLGEDGQAIAPSLLQIADYVPLKDADLSQEEFEGSDYRDFQADMSLVLIAECIPELFPDESLESTAELFALVDSTIKDRQRVVRAITYHRTPASDLDFMLALLTHSNETVAITAAMLADDAILFASRLDADIRQKRTTEFLPIFRRLPPAVRATALRSIAYLKGLQDASILPIALEQLADSDDDVLAATLRFMDEWEEARVAAPRMKELLAHANPIVRGQAGLTLSSFDPPPKEVVNTIVDFLDHVETWENGVAAVANYETLASAATPKLIARLKTKLTTEQETEVLHALSRVVQPEHAADVIPLVVPKLGKFEGSAIAVLASLGPAAAETVEEILPFVSSHDDALNLAAVDAIQEMGQVNPETQEALIGSMKDGLLSVSDATKTLKAAGRSDEAILAILKSALAKCEDEDVAGSLLVHLGEYGSASLDQIPTALRFLNDDDYYGLERPVAKLFKATLPGSAEHFEALLSAHSEYGSFKVNPDRIILGDPWDVDPTYYDDREFELEDLVAIARHTDKIGSFGDILLAECRSPSVRFRIAAAQGLGEIYAGPFTIRMLAHMLGDRDFTVRQAAAEALGKRRSVSALYVLVPGTHDKDFRVRLACIQAIGRSSQGDEASLKRLVELLNDPVTELRVAAIEALGTIGPASAKHLPAIVAMLRHEDLETRRATIDTIGLLGTSASEATKPLAAFKDHTMFGPAVRRALLRIETPRKDGNTE